ncbi:MAG: cobalamin-binding protein [Candidatus Margulisbacteria bacterium]|nr:cobalamin-binding protein [Candidatus Margulisiibacteriota bacterium]MBU1021834.1 cobalamin-binding protein [Candidatus Margulisiibacteriota bacterium]MBU1728993.1 cobalamin-binding protein [Candidatus Margulisiibacteriota bacterium]MBU1954454.1 cobalamin-binding protein [Candidatus Margulisiibacteriota bacterium]
MELKRKLSLFFAFAIVLILATASFAMLVAAKYPGYIEDEVGGKIYLKQSPQRIVSCMPSITEMLFAIGLEDRVVGVTLNCDYPPEAKQKEKVGRMTMNIEKILSLEPDLVVMLAGAQSKDIIKLKKHNLPVYVISPDIYVRQVMSSIGNLGRVTGNTKEAEALVNDMHARLEKIRAQIGTEETKSVIVIVGTNPLIVAGSGTFIEDMVKNAGGRNIANQNGIPWPQYSLERIIIEDPDVIIIAKGIAEGKKGIYNDRRWQSLKAVKNDRVLVVDADLISRPGPRVVDVVEQIAKFLHNI